AIAPASPASIESLLPRLSDREGAGMSIDPGACAEGYLKAGLSVLPIRRDGGKAPAVKEWKWLERQLPTADHLMDWWGRANPPGVAVICGRVSGNLELIDFDRLAESIFPR